MGIRGLYIREKSATPEIKRTRELSKMHGKIWSS